MFGWLKNKAQAKFVGIQKREVDDWIAKLRSLDSSEVATILAMAMHYRNTVLDEKEIDLMFPFVVITIDPSFALKVNHDVQKLQREKLFSMASGAIVWLFTLRAALSPELRESGRQIWAQLERVFPKVEEAAHGFYAVTGMLPDFDGAGKFPDGFTPDPI